MEEEFYTKFRNKVKVDLDEEYADSLIELMKNNNFTTETYLELIKNLILRNVNYE